MLEGAGSPVEVNLQPRDLTNLRLAQYLRAHCILVADIERGGVFAQLVGTMALLRPVERPLIRGLLINRFRGRRELFDGGRAWLEAHTGVPVLGVMPWLDELFPPEDSLDLLERRGRKSCAELEIAVLKLPSLSNFSDLDPLEAEPTVQVRWVAPGEELGQPDAVIVPGSKQTLRDLEILESGRLGEALRRFTATAAIPSASAAECRCSGGNCLIQKGLRVQQGSRVAGIGLLPLRTVFGEEKALGQRRSLALWPAAAASRASPGPGGL